MLPVWSMSLWLCVHRSSSSACQICPMLTQCTSTLWSGSWESFCLVLPTLEVQVVSKIIHWTTCVKITKSQEPDVNNVMVAPFFLTCFTQTQWRRESGTSMNISPSASMVIYVAACLRNTNWCLPFSCALASWWTTKRLTWWVTARRGSVIFFKQPKYTWWSCIASFWQVEWRYLLSGAMPVQQLANPAVSWLSERAWQDILGLSSLKNFSNLAQSFPEHLEGFKKIFDSSQPHRHVKPNTVLTHSHFAPSFVRCRSCECLTSCAYVCIFA